MQKIMVFEKVILIDAKDHMMGRLASTVAKELLKGQKIIVVRTEEISKSGSLFRNKMLMTHDIRKRTNTNPKKGPFHPKTPSRIFYKVVRGMIPHKTARGKAAMARLTVFEGVPHPYDKMAKKVMPSALRNLRLKPGRKWTRLGDLASAFGWKHNDLLARLEDKRKVKGAAYYAKKKVVDKMRTTALKTTEGPLAEVNAQLAEYGY